MRHHLKDKDLLARVQNASNQPVLVTANVEDDAVADDAGRSKLGPDISPRMPRDCLVADVRMPGPEGTFGVSMFRKFPELSKPSFGNDPHPMLFLSSASYAILVRKTRTVNHGHYCRLCNGSSSSPWSTS
jgi:hypothetical protein